MAILVFNAGSSSLKFRLYLMSATGSPHVAVRGAINHLGDSAEWTWHTAGEDETGTTAVRDHAAAATWVLQRLQAPTIEPIDAIGHRVVHGGEHFREPVVVDDAVIARLESLNPLAPLHNPPALAVMRACRALVGPARSMVAVFDTAFHASLPETAHCYALPSEWIRAAGIRRYGFHGIAHRYLYQRYRELCPAEPAARVVSFQLGHGCSVAAIRDGRSVETSMGYTPLEGLIMATRCGDVDPGAILQLASRMDHAQLAHGLTHAAGLRALSGISADMRELLEHEAAGHAGARRAIEAFCHRARKYLGAYLAVLGGADAILFGGGIGEHAPSIRARICADMQWCGVRLDTDANTAVGVEQRLSPPGARPLVYVIPVDEELMIARDTQALLARR